MPGLHPRRSPATPSGESATSTSPIPTVTSSRSPSRSDAGMEDDMAESLHTVRFPGEGAEYRDARNQLLQAEIDLRERMEAIARLRRSLPRGGRVPQDYEFEESGGSVKRRTKLSELFAPGKDS